MRQVQQNVATFISIHTAIVMSIGLSSLFLWASRPILSPMLSKILPSSPTWIIGAIGTVYFSCTLVAAIILARIAFRTWTRRYGLRIAYSNLPSRLVSVFLTTIAGLAPLSLIMESNADIVLKVGLIATGSLIAVVAISFRVA